VNTSGYALTSYLLDANRFDCKEISEAPGNKTVSECDEQFRLPL
jgi:hypothetical protein